MALDAVAAKQLQMAMLSGQRPGAELVHEIKRASQGDPLFINKVMEQVMKMTREDEQQNVPDVDMQQDDEVDVLATDISAIRRREECDAEQYIKMLEPYIGAAGHIVDIGSMSGVIPSCYADHWPEHAVIASDLDIPKHPDPTRRVRGMSLLRETLSQLADDASSPHRERYLSMCEQSVCLDVLQPVWQEVGHLNSSCAAVVCTALLNTNGFKTPHMWRNVLAGAANLLREEGVLLIFDCNFGGLGDRNVVEAFAHRVGLEVVEHAFHHHGGQNPRKECDVYKLILRRTNRIETLVAHEHSSGDLVLIDGLKSNPKLNGKTGVLDSLEDGRWGVHIAAGVTTKRKTISVRVKPENISSLMSSTGKLLDPVLVADQIDAVMDEKLA